MGDGVQAAKAGILEIGDIYVVNKADRDGASQVTRDLRSMLSLGTREEGSWRQPIIKAVASRSEGIDEIVRQVDAHREWMDGSGELARRRTHRIRDEIETIAVTALREKFADVSGDARLDLLAAAVLAGETDPFAAADTLIDAV
jgi:LAO/AO transport system kinase